MLHKTISALRAETWEAINRALLASAAEAQLERGWVVRLDSTVTAALMHEPSDSSLLWDAVRVMVRLLREAPAFVGEARCLWRDHRRAAKKRARAGQRDVDQLAVQLHPFGSPSGELDRRHRFGNGDLEHVAGLEVEGQAARADPRRGAGLRKILQLRPDQQLILHGDRNAVLKLLAPTASAAILAEVTAPSANLVVDTAQAGMVVAGHRRGAVRVTKAFSKLELRMPQHRINETSVRPQTQTS